MRPTDTDRPRGMLTSADREYLIADDPDFSEKTQAQKRYRIRQRVFNAILDFTLLIEHLDEKDREQIFGYEAADSDRDYFMEARQDVLTFMCLGTGLDEFHSDLRFALEEALTRQGRTVKSIDVNIETGISVGEFKERRRQYGTQQALDTISRFEVNQLWDAGVISDEEYQTWRESLG